MKHFFFFSLPVSHTTSRGLHVRRFYVETSDPLNYSCCQKLWPHLSYLCKGPFLANLVAKAFTVTFRVQFRCSVLFSALYGENSLAALLALSERIVFVACQLAFISVGVCTTLLVPYHFRAQDKFTDCGCKCRLMTPVDVLTRSCPVGSGPVLFICLCFSSIIFFFFFAAFDSARAVVCLVEI